MTTASRGGRRARLLLIAIAILVVLWCGYWFASNQIATAAAGKVVAALAAGGRDVACSENATGGFPFSLDLECAEVTFNDQGAGMAVALSKVAATAPLYMPGSVSAEVAGPLALEAPLAGGSLDATWGRAVAEADAGFSGLSRVALAVDDLVLRPTAGELAQQFIALDAERAELVAEPAADDAYRFVASADAVVAQPVEGEAMPVIAAVLDIVAKDFGSSLGLDPRHAVRVWAADGGAIDVSRIAASLGDASVEAEGALQLSPDGLLSGTLTVRLRGLEDLPPAIEAIRPGDGAKVAQLVAAAGMFTMPVPGDEDARQAQLVIKDSVVMMGMIPVATIPPLTF